jgi:surface antigen
VARRSSPVVAVAALSLVVAATSSAGTRPLVTTGYPYARDCPDAGRRDDVDRWRMNTCNCTSYVAWALAANGYRTDWFIAGAMDAWNWPHVARLAHLAGGTEPRPGAVAVWPRWGRFGHLAFVTAVDPDGSFDVAEYNLPGGARFRFDRRTGLAARNVSFIYVSPRR